MLVGSYTPTDNFDHVLRKWLEIAPKVFARISENCQQVHPACLIDFFAAFLTYEF